MRELVRPDKRKIILIRSKVILLLALLFVAVLAYGYWFASAHGSLYVWLEDASEKNHPRPIMNAEIIFLDSTKKEMARGKSDDLYGVVYLSGPEAYSCREVEQKAPFSSQARDAWDECFERQSRWLITWVRGVKYAQVRFGGCQLDKIPVSVSEYGDDWWLWWVPLRHIGGKPYTSFTIRIVVNGTECKVY